MKFLCLGYYNEEAWESLPQNEQTALVDECCAYDDVLRKKGHFAGGEALQSIRNSATVRYQDGKVVVTDGPYLETKEYIGGILVLEAKDLDDAIRIMSNHPGVKVGPFEIRPVEDISELIAESARRRGSKQT